MIAANNDPNTDLFGYPLFLGAQVVACVTVGDNATLRYGTIAGYKEKTNEVKITGGNCTRGLWRHPKQLVVLMLPGEIK